MEKSLTITEEEIKSYYVLNDQKRKIDREMKFLKNKFNQFLDDTVGKDQKGEVQRGNYKLQRQIRLATSYHEENTVSKLEDLNLEDLVVTVKRPDTNKLEAAFKLGLVDEDAFEDCKKVKVTSALIVKEEV